MNSKIPAFGLTLAAILLVSGCAPTPTQTIEGSRHEIYSSLDGLIAASTQIVVATAGGQTEVEGGTDGFTETSTTVTVEQIVEPSGLGTSNDLPHADIRAESEITVWQFGGKSVEGPAPLIQEGDTYLLFLNPTTLKDHGESSYYVTGVTAGLWGTDDGTRFARLADEGDKLPAELTVKDVAAR